MPADSRWERFRAPPPEAAITNRHCTEIWFSKVYFVQVHVVPIVVDDIKFPRTVLGIRRNSGAEITERWDELQAIKNEIAGFDKLAVEIFPPEALVVNAAPMRWLWVVPHGERVPMFAGVGAGFCEW